MYKLHCVCEEFVYTFYGVCVWSSSVAFLFNATYVYVHPQDLLYVWTEPKLCIGGVTLPDKKTLPCEGVEFWVRLGAGLGAFTAVLLVSLTCYFWKKNKRCNSLFSFWAFFSYPSPYFFLFLTYSSTSVLCCLTSFLLSALNSNNLKYEKS